MMSFILQESQTMNYHQILCNILLNGKRKRPQRNGESIPIDTIGTFCEVFRHDMSEGFPLTTLRPIPWKSLRIELEGFIKGVVQKTWYQERGCKYWDHWADPTLVEERLTAWNKKECPDATPQEIKDKRDQLSTSLSYLGPIYGAQWRYFGGYLTEASDQLKSIVHKLKTNPYDRRMVCSAWCPNELHRMALPPCHWGFNVVVYGDRLNLVWHQRSVDVALGLPSNIASYALLLLLLAKAAGLQPGELVGTLADCHIYDNHLDNVREMLKREERQLPNVELCPQNNYIEDFDIFSWEYNQVELINYNPHPKIEMGEVFV